MSSLCYDVYALILEELGRGDDIWTLTHCALVSRDFSNIAKRLLYQTIRLFPSRNAPRICEALYTTLCAHPHLAKSIQHLHLRDLSYAEGCGLRNWMALDQSLHLLLQLLQPHLRSLNVEGLGRLQCRYFAPALRDAFRFVFQGPNLEEVRLSNLDQFPILPFPSMGGNIKRLAMWSLVLTEPDFYELQSIPLPLRFLTVNSTSETEPDHKRFRMELESLTIYCHGLEPLLFDMMQRHVDFSKMKRLCVIPTSTQDAISMQSWIAACSASLEHLTISPWPSSMFKSNLENTPFTEIEIPPCLPNLRTLTLIVLQEHIDTANLGMPDTAASFLIRLLTKTTLGKLEVLTLLFPEAGGAPRIINETIANGGIDVADPICHYIGISSTQEQGEQRQVGGTGTSNGAWSDVEQILAGTTLRQVNVITTSGKRCRWRRCFESGKLGLGQLQRPLGLFKGAERAGVNVSWAVAEGREDNSLMAL